MGSASGVGLLSSSLSSKTFMLSLGQKALVPRSIPVMTSRRTVKTKERPVAASSPKEVIAAVYHGAE